MTTDAKTETERVAARQVWCASLLAAALLGGLVLHLLREHPSHAAADAGGQAATTPPRSPPRTHGLPAERSVAGRGVPAEFAVKTAPEQTTALPAGAVPVSRVDPRPPDPNAPLPPPPAPPPNPAEHRPAMHNPGGANGDRPKRPVAGLE